MEDILPLLAHSKPWKFQNCKICQPSMLKTAYVMVNSIVRRFEWQHLKTNGLQIDISIRSLINIDMQNVEM